MREGVLIYDHESGRMDIRFGLLDFYGGLHCGECLEVNINGEWIPTRIELGSFWYIATEHLSLQEMIDQLEISKRTYYRLRQQAITILSIRLWATPAIGIDFWFDMLTLLENLE